SEAGKRRSIEKPQRNGAIDQLLLAYFAASAEDDKSRFGIGFQDVFAGIKKKEWPLPPPKIADKTHNERIAFKTMAFKQGSTKGTESKRKGSEQAKIYRLFR